MSPLFNHVASQIETLMDEVQFDESTYILQGFKSALITACDPVLYISKGEEFKRVMLVMQSFSSFLSSGAVPTRGSDNELILSMLNISNLPTNL